MVNKTASIIDRIKANIADEMLTYKVEAWSAKDDDFIVYWKPPTLEIKQKIQRNAQGDDFLTTVFAVIFIARNEQGELIFSPGDKTALLKQLPSAGIEDLAVQFLGVKDKALTLEK